MLLGPGKPLNTRVDVQADAKLGEDIDDARPHFALSQKDAPGLLATKKIVLRNGHRRGKTEVLHDGVDARAARLGGSQTGDLLAPQIKRAGVGRMGSDQQADKGRLSRAVFAQKHVDLRLSQIDADVLEDGEGAITLPHAGKRDHAVRRGEFAWIHFFASTEKVA